MTIHLVPTLPDFVTLCWWAFQCLAALALAGAALSIACYTAGCALGLAWRALRPERKPLP